MSDRRQPVSGSVSAARPALRVVVPGSLYVREHPVRFAGGEAQTRMTVIVREGGGVILHAPIPFDDVLEAEVRALGDVVAILAPSTCHHVFVANAQRTFPGVPAYGVAGLEKKRPDLGLTLFPDALWADELDRVVVGNALMREVVLYHRKSRTLIAVDLVEHFRDETAGVDRVIRTWIKLLGMWNVPRPAPELRWFTRDRAGARRAIERILSWDFDRMLIAHGELFETGAKEALREAWKFVLRAS